MADTNRNTSGTGDLTIGLDNAPDEELMRQVHLGNGDALTMVFRRYHRLVFITAFRILRDLGEAEDLMQCVFFEIYRKAAQFDPERGTLSKWILQYAYHRSINRKNYLTMRHFYEEAENDNGNENGGWDTLVTAPAQHATQLSKEALAILDLHQRQIIELVFFGGLTLREIAEQTKQTYVSVRHHYYRGLKCMRDYLSAAAPVTETKRGLMGFKRVSRANA